ncbi:NAD-P-binding protein [Mycena crocata]|nr:NAD-P-binding protein [Mycena crocata]
MARLLLTGASGYMLSTNLTFRTQLRYFSAVLYALVRTPQQAEKVQSFGAHPIQFDLGANLPQISRAVVENEVNIVLHTADAMNFGPAQMFIEALAEVKQRTGQPVHFIHTSGAKLFSSHAGVPSGHPIISDAQDVYTLQKTFKSPHPLMDQGINTNISILDFSESLDVRSYILVPPMVYGPGTGFGNKISIQFVAIVRIGAALQYLPQIPENDETWALCHLQDLVSLYMTLLTSIIAGNNPPSGRNYGYYFAENGVFSWKALYQGIASRLFALGYLKGSVADGEVTLTKATEEDIQRASQVLKVPPKFVPVSMCGDRGRKLGWEPKFGVDNLMGVISEEVDFIIKEDNLRPAGK